jgi:hypothetical protein
MIEDTAIYNQLEQMIKEAEKLRAPFLAKWRNIERCIDPLNDNADASNKTNPLINNVANKSLDSSIPYYQLGSGHGVRNTSSTSSLVRNAITSFTSQIASPSVKWFSIDISNPLYKFYLDKNGLSDYIRSAEDYLYYILGDPESNYYISNLSLYNDCYILGTGCRYIMDMGNNKFRFDSIPIKNISVNVDGYGKDNFVCREMSLNLYQAASLWGLENVLDNSEYELEESQIKLMKKVHKYYHVVMYNYNKKNMADFNYVGYILDDTKKRIIQKYEYYDNPYIIIRFYRNSGEIYGYSPLWYLVSDINYINHMAEMSRLSAEYQLNPIVITDPSFRFPKPASRDQVEFKPGMILPDGRDLNGRRRFEFLNLGEGLNVSEQIFSMKRKDVLDGLLFNDIFTQNSSNMTEREVMERTMEKYNNIAPIINRFEKEDISVTIKFLLKRIMGYYNSNGILEFPYESIGISKEELPDPVDTFDIKYIGLLTKMQKQYDDHNIKEIIQEAITYSQLPESVSEIINIDEVLRFKIQNSDLPNNIIYSREETENKRTEKMNSNAQAAQMAELQQQLQLGMAANELGTNTNNLGNLF